MIDFDLMVLSETEREAFDNNNNNKYRIYALNKFPVLS